MTDYKVLITDEFYSLLNFEQDDSPVVSVIIT